MKNWFRQLRMALARSGKKYRVLKYPILLLLLLMAAICRGIDAAKTLTRPAVRRRVMAEALSVCMVFTMLPMQAFAAKPTQNVGILCEHHPAHRLECGYTEGAAGSPCTHEHKVNDDEADSGGLGHTGDCYQEVTDCIHEHTAECYPEDDGVSGNAATPPDAEEEKKEPTECTHLCSEDTGCITQELICPHDRGEHDDACSYTEGTEGRPCTYLCEICNPAEEDAKAPMPMMAKAGDPGWVIDESGNLTISTKDGMDDWVKNGKLTNNSNVKTVTIANDVDKIPGKAFRNCYQLTSASAPGVKNIVASAFENCSNLAALSLSATPPNVGTDTFTTCSNNRKLNFVDEYGADLTGTALATAQAEYKAKADGDTTDNLWYGWIIEEPVADQGWAIDASGNLTITTSEGMTDWVANGLAANKDTVKTATIDVTVTEILSSAFNGCTMLTAVTAKGATIIGDSAFENCKALKSIDFPVVETIGKKAFFYCEALTSASFPKAATIGESAFEYCPALESIDFPVATTIGNKAFSGCTALTSITLSNGVTSIGGQAFKDCNSLATVTMNFSDGKAKTIGSGSFAGTTGATINVVAKDATPKVFKTWSSTTTGGTAATFTSAATATTTLTNVPSNCTITAEYEVPVTKYAVTVTGGTGSGDYAENATVTIAADTPEDGKEFDKWTTTDDVTFADAAAATTTFAMPAKAVTVTASHKAKVNAVEPKITSDLSTTQVTYTVGGTAIALDATATVTDGGIISYDWYSNTTNSNTGGTKLNVTTATYTPLTTTAETTYYYCVVTNTNSAATGTKTAKITSAVANIKVEATSVDKGWEIDASGNLTISTAAGMTDWVANGRDTNKSNLKTATIAKGILSIDKDAFKNCTKLTSVSISDGVTFIGNGAFWGCTKLTSVIIPDSVITIENFAFISTGLTSVTFKSTKPPTLGRTIFLNTPDNLIIYVPQGSVDAYKEVSNLSDMKDKIKVAGLPSESIPTATFTATGSATGTLSNVSTGMKYSTNGTNWTEISSGADISLTGLSPCTISVVKKGDGTTTSDSEAQTISVTQAAQPTGVGKTDETVAKNDGTITGVTTAMEYKLSTSSTYTDISSTTVTGLAPGTYQVRTKATGTVLASADTSVTIDTVVTLISIAVTTQPTKTTYIAGEYFDTAGMVITATYSNNNTAVVTGYSVSSSGALAASDTTVTISYTKDGITKTTDVTITVKAKINAVAPTISTDLSETEVTYIKDAAATALSISAETSDGGVLSYEWYSNTTNSTTGGTKLTGTAANYTPSTASVGTTYYYCIVTNTITDNGDGGTKTATATSKAAKIKVEATPVDKGWTIDANDNLTISTKDGMDDWVTKGRDINKDSVKTATIAETVPEIPYEAFKNCTELTNVTANGAISISANAFMSCNKLATVEFLKTKTIGAYAFAYCSKLVAVKFPETKTIGDSAFSGCKALTSVSFPETTSIVRYAFWECETLTSASFPKATTIGVSAFNDCKALATLKLGATPPTVGTDAFIGCPATRALAFVDGGEKPLTDDALTAAQVNYKGFADGNTTDNLWYGWTIDKGWRIDASGNLTISTADGMTDWVTNGLSVNETTVKTAIIDEAVTEIPSDAFKQCSVLTNVTANGATNIGSYAFYDCIALTSASFPAAKTIGFYSFRGCEALTSASFPAAETIGNTAFRACKALTSTSFPAVETIANSAFSDCTALTSASFPKVETIGESAFYGCTALTSANFPVVATIGRAAFYDCSKLATLKLPAAPPSAPAASTFGKCPATRALALVDAEGTALTGDALTNAQTAYKAVPDGDATDTLWYGWKIDVAPPTTPTVTSVAVTPETASVQQGKTQQFTAAVTGTNSPAQTVTWKVTGGKTGTSISTGGLLTVASDETAATLAVTATSTVDTTKSGTATVTVTSTPVTKYTLTVTNGTGGGSYEAGASVTATANAAPSNQHFKEWTATGLANATYTTNPLTVTMPAQAVTLNAVYEAIPTYTITASPTEKDFGSLEKGYTPPAAQTITVTNTGNSGVTLTQPTNANYTIGTLSSTTVVAGGIATFTIQPGPGLAEGVYDAAITISTNHSTSAAVTVKFTVTPPSITGFTFTQTSGLKEEQDNVKTGAVAGTFSAPQGGTEPFTYTLASNSGNDTDNGKFTIDGTNLKVGSSALTEGTYKAYVQVSDTKGKTFGKAITITVTEADPRYTITASPTEKDFGSLKEDYTAPPAAQTITVTNTGNQTMTLTQPTGTNFTIGALSKTTIERDETATFTIQPNPGLTEKKYSEIISIKTDNGTSATVAAKFEVTLPSITGYSFKQNLDLQEENANANAGAIAGEFINPQGGTGEFTYTLVSNSGNNMDNGKFTIEGTNLKIGSSALTEGSYMAYVLATDTKGKTLGKIIPILVKKAKPRYTITASPSDADFGTLVEDYETPPAKKTITVTNTGNQTMTLTQPTGTNFTIGALSSTTIERDKTATFTIQPKLGLTEKEYSETITINTGNGTSATVTAKFEVTLPVIDGYTFTQTAGLQEEKANANAGAVAGIFSDPKGGTGTFTYTLAAHEGADTDNGKFTIDGTNLKIGSSALTVGTYKAYVLATDTKEKTFGKAITITVAKADPRYTITASPSDADFGKLVEDYTAPPAAQTITITNTGNQTMTLTQPTSTNFTIGALSSTTIERDKTATFTIQPKLGLTEKEYSETITINTGNDTSATVTAKFEVTLPVIDGYTFTQTAGLQEEKTNAEAGAVAGTFSDPKGGTGAFTYTLTAQAGDDTDNGRFEIAGTNLKVKGSALTEGTYKAYVLATDTKDKTFGKAITVTVAKADPRYTITASPTDKDFGSVRRKYTAPAAQTITITNTGNQTMTLTQPTSTNFTISALSSTTIARDKTATFTIQPKTGLAEGVYDETITINTGNGTSATVTVKFTVTSALVYDLTVNGSYAQSTGAGTYEGDATVNINAGTRSRYTFTGWTSSGGGTFADAGSASTTFTMPEGNVTITAAWRSNGGGGGGGSSSGGSGSSGGSSSGTIPSPSQPVVKIPGTGQATIPTTVDQNGNANVSVTDKNITDAIADAKKDAVQGQPITVEIKVNTDKDASQLITTLPQSVRDTLINNQVGSLTIGSKDVSMNFSQAALLQMNAQAQGNLIITATKADTGKLTGNAQTLIGNHPIYDFKATCDGRIITELGVNAVTITIPYILKAGETAVNVQAFRVDANGVATVVPGSYYDVTKQAVVFTTGQVSAIYGIGCRQTAASVAHRVQRGETLAMIAKRYQTTVQAIAAINGISNPDRIEIGQEIQIPQ